MSEVRATFSDLYAYADEVDGLDSAWRGHLATMRSSLDAFFGGGYDFGPTSSAVPESIDSFLGDLQVTAVGVRATAWTFGLIDMSAGLGHSSDWEPNDDWVERQRRFWLKTYADDMAGDAVEPLGSATYVNLRLDIVAQDIEDLEWEIPYALGQERLDMEQTLADLKREQSLLREDAHVYLADVNRQINELQMGFHVTDSQMQLFELRAELVKDLSGDPDATHFIIAELNSGASVEDALAFGQEAAADAAARAEALRLAGNAPQPGSVDYYNLKGEFGLGIPGMDAFGQAGGSLRVETYPDGTRVLTVGRFGGVGVSAGEGAGVSVTIDDVNVGAFGEAEAKGMLFIAAGDQFLLPSDMTVAEFVQKNFVGSLDPADHIPDLPSMRIPGVGWRTPSVDPSLWTDPPDRIATSTAIGVEGTLESGGIVGGIGMDFLGPLENFFGQGGGVSATGQMQLIITDYETENLQGVQLAVSGEVDGSITFMDMIKDEDGNSVLGLDIEGGAGYDSSLEVIYSQGDNSLQEVVLNLGVQTGDSYSMNTWVWDLNDPAARAAWEAAIGSGDPRALLDVLPAATGANGTEYHFDSSTYGVEADVTVVQGEIEFEVTHLIPAS